jgi:hypothetical protein
VNSQPSWAHHSFAYYRAVPTASSTIADAGDHELEFAPQAELDRLKMWNLLESLTPGRRRIFCDADIFDEISTDVLRFELWNMFVATSNLDWVLRTSNPVEMEQEIDRLGNFPNIWAGVTVEDGQGAGESIAVLARIRVPVRFVDLIVSKPLTEKLPLNRIDWVIARSDCESPDAMAGLRDVRDQCEQLDVKFFCEGTVIDGTRHCQIPKNPVSRQIRRFYTNQAQDYCRDLASLTS